MLIEIFSPKELNTLAYPAVKEHLKQRFKEIGGIKDPSTEGYFVFVEHFHDLYQRNNLRYVSVSSIDEGLFRHIEGFTIKNDIVEVSLSFNNEFLLTLVFYGLDEQSISLILNGGQSYRDNRLQEFSMLSSPAVSSQHDYVQSAFQSQRQCGSQPSHGSPEVSGAMLGVGMFLLRCLLKR